MLYDVMIYLFGREATVLISSISFSFLFSVFPFIVLLLTLANYLQWVELREAIFESFYHFFPISQEFIIRNLRIYTQRVGQLTLISVVLLAWAGSVFFFALEAGLDSAYRVPKYRHFVTSQLIGTIMTVTFGVVAFMAIELLEIVERLAAGLDFAAAFVDLNILLTLILILLFQVYYFLPNRKQTVAGVLPESLFASVLWMLSNLIFKLLAASWSLQDIYGPFYISVTLLLWGYISGAIIIGSARLSQDGFFRSKQLT